jgi:hypothetical protein
MAVTAYQGIPLQKAGERFGLTAEDLEELFSLRESGDSGDTFMPLVQTKTTEKGRGGVLGYKAAKAPTAFKTYGDLEGKGNIVATGGSIGDIKISAPKLEQAPAQKTYQGIAEGVNIYEDTAGYGVGFGPGDLRRARNEGYSDESIKKFLETYRGGIGEDAAKMLGISGRAGQLQAMQPAPSAAQSTSSQPAQKTYQGVAEGVNIYEDTPGYGVGFGPGDLRRARNEGYSDESIRQYLQSYRGGIGEDAARLLNIQGRGPL